MSKNTKRILAVILLLVVAAAVLLLYQHFGPKASEGAKTVTMEVVHGDESKKEFVLHTDAENLRQALEEKKLIAGTDSDYGLYVQTVDGETADEGQQQWWCLTKDGEMSMTGVDDTMIQDGEHYEFTLTTGW